MKWSHVRLPMLADSADDPLSRPFGASLWPEYFSAEFIADRQRDPMIWQALFQQTPPNDAGSWVTPQHLVAEMYPPEPLTYVAAVDLALSVGRGDFTVIMVAGMDAQRHLHVVHVMRDRISPETTVQRLLAICNEYPVHEVLIDDDPAARVFTRLLIEIERANNRPLPPINPQPMRGRDKETRAAAIRGLFLASRVHILQAPWTQALQRELLAFPAGDHDDQVDCLGLIGRRFPMLSNPPEEPHEKSDPWSNKLVRPGPDGRLVYAATLDEMFDDRERMERARNYWS